MTYRRAETVPTFALCSSIMGFVRSPLAALDLEPAFARALLLQSSHDHQPCSSRELRSKFVHPGCTTTVGQPIERGLTWIVWDSNAPTLVREQQEPAGSRVLAKG